MSFLLPIHTLDARLQDRLAASLTHTLKDETMETPHANEFVDAHVQHILPFGIMVTLADGSHGIIREREISWDYLPRRKWQNLFKIGDQLRAVVLGPGHDARLELSLRLAENDPWANLEQRYPLGGIVDGVVTGVQAYGIFIELEAGVTGLLHHTRIPTWAATDDMRQIFWIGDRIKVVIERIDLKHRQIGLSLQRALSQRWMAATDSVTLTAPTSEHRGETSHFGASNLTTATYLGSVLLIEDDPSQRNALVKWLVREGRQVVTATTAEEALGLLEQQPIDAVLTDFGLPQMSGIELIMIIQHRWPDIHCALMTDWARADEERHRIEALWISGVPLLLKPLRPVDLTDLFSFHFGSTLYERSGQQPSDHIEAFGKPAGQSSTQCRIGSLLAQGLGLTHATKAIIFGFDSTQRIVRVVEEAGNGMRINRDMLGDLIYSPVRDVAEDQRICRIADTHHVESQVRYLKPILHFRSCIGVPLPAQTFERFALFLFGVKPQAFNDLHEEYAAALALAASAILEREQFALEAADIQRQALMGQLSRALVHELNHQISPIYLCMSELADYLEKLESAADQSREILDSTIHMVGEVFQDMAIGINRLVETAHMFGQVARQSREQSTLPGDVVREAVYLIRDMADRAHVNLFHAIPDGLPSVAIQPIQLRQVLLNIIINAIQQIGIARPETGGNIHIRIVCQQGSQPSSLRILIEDDGPGIHCKLWDRIFDLGFTTRNEGGSGLGLHISRSLVIAANGQVSIQNSIMFWGTTFVIELPTTQ